MLADVLDKTILAGMVVQAAGQLILAGMAYGAYRAYHRSHLRLLAGSWLGLSIYQLDVALGMALGAPEATPRAVLSLLGSLAGYAQIVWLVLGVQGLTTGRDVARRTLAAGTVLAAVVGSGLWVLTAGASSELSFFVRVCVRSLLAALAFLLASSLVLTRRRHGLGRCLVAGGFAVYALDLLQYFSLGLPGGALEHAIHLGYVDILALMLSGLGLVLMLLEDERERATAALERLNATHHERLHASKMEALGRMAGGVSHDFNNLLTAMRGHLELALERTPHKDIRRADLEQAWRAAERACHLTQQLLSFSRSRPIAPRATCDLVASLHELRPLLLRLLGQGIELVYDLPEGTLFVGIDRTGLEQVVFNLGANSRDAMPNGGRLRLGARLLPGTDALASTLVEVTVADNGCGMDDATRARIFDPFFTTKPPGFGTGLGLAQVYGIIQQGRGQIECSSTPGRGTTFKLVLPLSDAPAETVTPVPGPMAPDHTKGRERVVMLVDDDTLVRQLLCRSLREQGFTVIEAADPIEALTLDAEFDEPIDLLVTDLAMPKLSGTELAARICERRPHMRLLFITGFAASHTPSPDVELLQKPFAQTAFLARVEKLFAPVPGEPQRQETAASR